MLWLFQNPNVITQPHCASTNHKAQNDIHYYAHIWGNCASVVPVSANWGCHDSPNPAIQSIFTFSKHVSSEKTFLNNDG